MYSREELVELLDMAQQTVDLSVRQLAHLRDAASRLAPGGQPDGLSEPVLVTARAALACLDQGNAEGARQVLGSILPRVVPEPLQAPGPVRRTADSPATA
jgi:hypothetical protein